MAESRASLMPTREQVERAVLLVEALRSRHAGRIVIDAVIPDYYARFPKAERERTKERPSCRL